MSVKADTYPSYCSGNRGRCRKKALSDLEYDKSKQYMGRGDIEKDGMRRRKELTHYRDSLQFFRPNGIYIPFSLKCSNL